MKLTATTGANLVAPTPKDAGNARHRKFTTEGRGVDYRGETRRNEFRLVSVIPAKSNDYFTVVNASLGTGHQIELPIYHNKRYFVPQEERSPEAATASVAASFAKLDAAARHAVATIAAAFGVTK